MGSVRSPDFRVLVVFGTRPEAIKMSPVVQALSDAGDEIHHRVCVTAQHREMLDQVLAAFDISAHYDLDVMRERQDLYGLTAAILSGMHSVLDDYRPNMVLVHGDTTTTMAASLAAFYQQIRVGHVEAGLRTKNVYSPWPEEMNRVITARIADKHFAPTEASRNNLIAEGIRDDDIFVTGNTVIDSLNLILEKIGKSERRTEAVLHTIRNCLGGQSEKLDAWREGSRRLVLITGHRRENFGEGLKNACAAIRTLAAAYSDVDWLYPVHMNPNVSGVVRESLGGMPNLILTSPLDYEPFVFLMSLSYLVLTDSGGIQEEAPSLGKPVLLMRDTTERPEGVEAGTVMMVGTNTDEIVRGAKRLLDHRSEYEAMSQAINPYGDGYASRRIVAVIKQIASLNIAIGG